MLGDTGVEGMGFDTGWKKDGIWNYFASFHGHAQLCPGRGREEGGDMPHNRASTEPILPATHDLFDPTADFAVRRRHVHRHVERPDRLSRGVGKSHGHVWLLVTRPRFPACARPGPAAAAYLGPSATATGASTAP